MTRILTTFLALGLLSLCASPLLAESALDGEWKLLEINAGENSPPAPKDAGLKFENGKMTPIKNGNESKSADFTTNETVTPNTIDLVIPEGPDAGKTSLGIFQITGNKLTLCMSISGGGERPTEFAPNPEQRRVVMVLERK